LVSVVWSVSLRKHPIPRNVAISIMRQCG